MKIRKSFVSNSSSCSFTVFGILKYTLIDKYSKNEDIFDNLPTELHKHIYNGQYYDELYFGNLFCENNQGCFVTGLHDDETPNQFKERTIKLIKETFGEDISEEDIEYCSESWYNG